MNVIVRARLTPARAHMGDKHCQLISAARNVSRQTCMQLTAGSPRARPPPCKTDSPIRIYNVRFIQCANLHA